MFQNLISEGSRPLAILPELKVIVFSIDLIITKYGGSKSCPIENLLHSRNTHSVIATQFPLDSQD